MCDTLHSQIFRQDKRQRLMRNLIQATQNAIPQGLPRQQGAQIDPLLLSIRMSLVRPMR